MADYLSFFKMGKNASELVQLISFSIEAFNRWTTGIGRTYGKLPYSVVCFNRLLALEVVLTHDRQP